MSSLEAVRPEILGHFSGADAAKQQVLDLEGRTDRDFIGEDGRLSEQLRRNSAQELRDARQAYSSIIAEGLGRLVTSEVASNELDLIVLHGSLDDRFSGFSKIESRRFVPDGSEVVVDYGIDQVDKYQEVFNWWRNPSELFAHFESSGVSLYRSPVEGRVTASGSYELYGKPNIKAEFKEGVKVAAGNRLPGVVGEAGDLSVGIYGWDGHSSKKLDDFKGDDQERYLFLNAESAQGLHSSQRFRLRIAQEALVEQADIDVIEIPVPDEEFSLSIAQAIAKSVIKELLGRELQIGLSRGSRGVTNVSLSHTATEVSGYTFPRLQQVFRAGNVSAEMQIDGINQVVRRMQESDALDEYFKGIKVESLAKRFIKDKLEA